MWLFRKRKIYEEIENYLQWKESRYSSSFSWDREYLLLFAHLTKVEEVNEINPLKLELFMERIGERSRYYVEDATRAVRCLIRYYRARGYPCLRPDEVVVAL